MKNFDKPNKTKTNINNVLEKKTDIAKILGDDLINIGEEIKTHPPIKRLKEIAMKLGKDIMSLFSKIKKDEQKDTTVKSKINENVHEEMTMREKFKRSIKPMIAYGMYALVLLGNTSCTENKTKAKGKDENNIELKTEKEFVLDESKIARGEKGTREENYTYYDKSIFSDFDTFYRYAKNDIYFSSDLVYNLAMDGKIEKEDYREIYEIIVENINEIEKVKSEELEKIKSDDYLKKLTKELKTNIAQAERIRNERLKRLLNLKYYISNHESESRDNAYGTTDIDHENPKVYLAYNILANKIETIRHEIQHAILGEEEDIPKATQHKVLNHFNKENFNKNEIERLYDPHEILARKAVFDEILETYGIKKYGEKFTKEHYKKIKELMDLRNTLDGNDLIIDENSNIREFFKMFEKDALIMIMNTVAYQEHKEKGVPIEEVEIAEEIVAQIIKKNPNINLDKLDSNKTNSHGDTYYPPEWYDDNNSKMS